VATQVAEGVFGGGNARDLQRIEREFADSGEERAARPHPAASGVPDEGPDHSAHDFTMIAIAALVALLGALTLRQRHLAADGESPILGLSQDDEDKRGHK
jgi:hypothetical protein